MFHIALLKNIVASIFKLQGRNEDVEMKENLDPKTLNKDADLQLHVQTVMGDAEIKQNPELIISTPHMDTAPVQLSGPTSIEDKNTKDKTEIIIDSPHLESTPAQFHAPRTIDVLIKKNIGTSTQNSRKNASHVIRKKHLKRIAVTPEENALYDRLTRVGVKLSKCRSEIKKQAIKIKCLQNLNTHLQFLKTGELAEHLKTFDSPAIQRTQERR
ncbi:uncharacterized protein LOC123662771 [Melitaea cinxia]|uniref:uncharacterized protein LOC123662771 n=1 Tax=Melitaea cinxia TaxID=113334 RepID=UPI001E26F8DE|nr:uncharacterized protein LOC123662771 [Melitaea cinxia]